MITCVEMGWTDVLIPRPEAEVIMEAIHKYKARFIPTVPTIFYGIINHPKLHKYNLTSIDVCLSGAAPLPAEIMEKFELLTGTRITEFYGMTEMSAGATGNPVGEGAVTKVGSVGVPLPETDMKIVDLENGTNEVLSGEHGEIIFKGPQVTQGYYQMPEETTQACAIGIPGKYKGETVKAFIVLKPGQEMKTEEVIEYCKTKLAAYKVPKIVEFIDELPSSSAGKILRKELRAMEL